MSSGSPEGAQRIPGNNASSPDIRRYRGWREFGDLNQRH
jgi:hypothetical protein